MFMSGADFSGKASLVLNGIRTKQANKLTQENRNSLLLVLRLPVSLNQ